MPLERPKYNTIIYVYTDKSIPQNIEFQPTEEQIKVIFETNRMRDFESSPLKISIDVKTEYKIDPKNLDCVKNVVPNKFLLRIRAQNLGHVSIGCIRVL